MLTWYRVKAYFKSLQKDDAAGWKELQQLWTKDMLWAILLGLLFGLQYCRLQAVWVTIVFLVFCFAGYILLWRRRVKLFPDKYTWWTSWCLVTVAPYGAVVFLITSFLYIFFSM